jgi:uncharacterized protein YggU (UPF0235/DUF167 family)
MYIRVMAYPSAKKEQITEVGESRYEIKIKEPAERNLANLRIRQLLAEKYGIEEGKVRLVSGHQNSRKIFSIPD